MAKPGARPKPAQLRLVEGTRNATRHGSEDDLRRKAEAGLTSFGPLVRPKGMRGEALKAWKSWIEPAFWLDGARTAAAVAFCELWQEFRDNPRGFPASKHGQLRHYMSELGLTDERNRSDVGAGQSKDKFFD